MATETVHATCVALNGQAVLLTGKSGSGKSTVALELLAFGAELVADDQVILTAQSGNIIASAPPTTAGLIEARGFGVLNADFTPQARVVAVMDLEIMQDDRVPERQQITILGHALPLFHRPKGRSLAPTILQYLRRGISDR